MKRCHTLQSSKEIVFIDSSCSCERSSATVTVVLTVSKAGAIPLAVLFHVNQTAESYAEAFNLLRRNFPSCFGGIEDPIFMTDDSQAEKKALKDVWPQGSQLLCHFHVAQAQWRWIFAHSIPMDEKPRLMKLFQAVMYANSENQLDDGVKAIVNEKGKYPEFVEKFQKKFLRREEGVLFFRKNLITRGCNTNNYAEASIRILKDVVLHRTKVYNVVALVEFSISTWENYLTKKLLHVAYSRISKPYLLYSSLCLKMKNYEVSNIVEVEKNIFLFQSCTDDNKSYVVHSDVGVCTCFSGKRKIRLPNALPVTKEERYELGLLALGDKCPKQDFFDDLKSSSTLSLQSQMAQGFNELESNSEPETCTK